LAYKAIIARVYTRPHPNADRIQLGECRGYQVIVGKDVEDGTLGVLFPPDGQLSHEFCLANELYARHPETGEKMKGFFDKNRRVRAQKFRGEKSEAFWTGLESIYKMAGLRDWRKDLPEGKELDEYLGMSLCQKYVTPATRRAQANKQQAARRELPNFHKHFDTDQLKREIDYIPEGALLYFTEKLHGTSQRSAYLTVESDHKLPWLQRLGLWLSRIPFAPPTQDEHLLGTRNVVLGRYEGKSYYGSEGFRYRHHDRIKDKLHLGETVYYEVVGFTGPISGVPEDPFRAWDANVAPIMPAVSTKALRDHWVSSPDQKVAESVKGRFPEMYGDTMWYTYGNWEADSPAAPRAMGGSEIYVYRITQQNAQGIVLDLSWEQVKGRCEELGVPHVPELAAHKHHWRTEALMEHAEQLAEGPSTLDRTHIREGVCVRWEKGKKIGILKHKSFEFLVLEGVVKTDENYVDLEESS
jgi:hypothetical protein